MFFVYVIRSKKDGELYTGFTNDVQRRLKDHNEGLQTSTKSRVPFELIYYEWCVDKQDAIDRENYLKSGMGKRFIRNRLKHYLEGQREQVFGSL